MKHGKKYADSVKLIDHLKQYDPEEAVALGSGVGHVLHGEAHVLAVDGHTVHLAIGIAALNYLLYLAGLVLVVLLFCKNIPRWKFLLLLCAPMTVIYMIPYSEALFFITIALGLYGMVRRRYWLFFVGFFLACATRAAGNILAVAFVITDVLVGLRNRDSFSKTLLNALRHLAPIVAAVLAVVLFQHLRGAEH